MIDVVVGDDHGVFVDALSTVLGQQRLIVRAVAHRTADVLEAVAAHRPDVCLLDRTFVDGDGLDLIPDLLDASPGTRIIVVTADAGDDAVQGALHRGAHGFVHKTRGVTALIEAIHRVVEGQTVVELPPRRRALRGSSAGPDPDVARLASHLTGRERECLALLVAGSSTNDMAHRMGVSVTTVRTHVQTLMTKLGVHTRLEAAALAARHQLVSPA